MLPTKFQEHNDESLQCSGWVGGVKWEIHIEFHCLLIYLEGYISLGVDGYWEVKEIDSISQIRNFPGEEQSVITVFFVGIVWLMRGAAAFWV